MARTSRRSQQQLSELVANSLGKGADMAKQPSAPIDPVDAAITAGDVDGIEAIAEQHYSREAIAAKFAEVEMLETVFRPAAISLNSQGWKYFVSLTPGQCVPVDGANYQGISVVVDRAQVEPVVLVVGESDA